MADAARERTTGLLRLWFGFTAPVSRGTYLFTGQALMTVKYALEALVVHAYTGRWWTPLEYFSPSVQRFKELQSPALAWAIAIWTLPFIWIGASMTVRRTLDAGLPARVGLLFFVPVLNNITMLVLAVLPTRPKARDLAALADDGRAGGRLRAAMLGVLVGCLIVATNIAFGTLVLRSYSSILFVGTPFVVGFVTASIYNAEASRTLRSTLGLTTAALIAAAGVVLLLAFEGAMCLAMAFPLALALAFIGAALGRAITVRGHAIRPPIVLLLLALPALMGLSSVQPPGATPGLTEVRSDIEVNAPPEVVWKNVVSFTELASPTEWFFRAGIAYPIRARIDGAGAGAVRRCEFSTGPFVEPITTWDPPHRLAFDVASEPPGLRELSPYDEVHAPHTAGYLRSRRGEFRLVPLPGGRTRLEGSTYYTLQIFPAWYWTPYADALIHAIHLRVLRHIKALAETAPLSPR